MIFFNFFMKNRLLSCSYLVKKRQFCQNYTILRAKSKPDALFLRFFMKNHWSNAHILSKNRQFSKKHIALMSIFCQKNVHSPKNTVLLFHFFQIFLQRTNGDAHFWSNKDQFCQNFTILRAKKLNRMPFFPILHEKKPCSHVHILAKKTSIL